MRSMRLRIVHDQPEAPARAMAVLTNKPVRPAQAICEALGLARYFLNIYGGNSFNTKKPDPEGLLALMSEAGARAGRDGHDWRQPGGRADGAQCRRMVHRLHIRPGAGQPRSDSARCPGGFAGRLDSGSESCENRFISGSSKLYCIEMLARAHSEPVNERLNWSRTQSQSLGRDACAGDGRPRSDIRWAASAQPMKTRHLLLRQHECLARLALTFSFPWRFRMLRFPAWLFLLV